MGSTEPPAGGSPRTQLSLSASHETDRKSRPNNPIILSLTRYTLSIVLSHLSDRDGLSALLTNSLWAKRVLPVFRLSSGSYRFVAVPAQDPTSLLARLNSRRLRKRLSLIRRNGDGNIDGTKGEEGAYWRDLSTDELADLEWRDSVERGGSYREHVINGERTNESQIRRWPAHLELLRFPSRVKTRPVCVLASYPRSGNTLLRTLMERITGIATGSDTRPDRTLSKALAMKHDMVGEGVVNPVSGQTGQILREAAQLQPTELLGNGESEFSKLPFMVKTHYPERRGSLPYRAHSCILLVRNPFDALDSYWNLCLTNTHTQTVCDSVYLRYRHMYEDFGRSEMETWCRFHYWWENACSRENVPLLVVRYEDLVLHTEREMTRIMQFLLGAKVISDSYWGRRINHALGLDELAKRNQSTSTDHLGSYRPRTGGNRLASIGKSIKKGRYSDETLRCMHGIAKKIQHFENNKFDSPQSESDTDIADHEKQDESLLNRFGYHTYSQGFPKNFGLPCQLGDGNKSMATTKQSKGLIRVNKATEIRSRGDPYGRAMTNWRRGETNNDKNPFPTAPCR